MQSAGDSERGPAHGGELVEEALDDVDVVRHG
jgi:hypothetical protein